MGHGGHQSPEHLFEPKFTIVTPCFNQVKFIERTICSVLSQDYRNLEFIVMDGGSTDGSVDIIRKYADKLAYWTSGRDHGQADALSMGFSKATGDIMGWINSDDILLPRALSTVVEYFRCHKGTEIVNGGSLQITADDDLFQCHCNYTLGVSASYSRLCLVDQRNFFQQSTFWTREAYVEAGGINPKLQFIMDLDLFTRIARRSRVARVPELLGAFRIHCDAKTATIQDVHRRELAWFEETYSLPKSIAGIKRAARWFYFFLVYAEKIGLYLRKPWMTRKGIKLLQEVRECCKTSAGIE